MKIKLHHLRYMIVVAEHRSFRRAARALDVNPSAICRSVRRLEDWVGAAFFIRYHTGVELTYAGDRFVVYSRKVIMRIDEAAREVLVIARKQHANPALNIADQGIIPLRLC